MSPAPITSSACVNLAILVAREVEILAAEEEEAPAAVMAALKVLFLWNEVMSEYEARGVF